MRAFMKDDHLYYGFNEDEQHRKVFDGVMSLRSQGGWRGSFDCHRFADSPRVTLILTRTSCVRLTCSVLGL